MGLTQGGGFVTFRGMWMKTHRVNANARVSEEKQEGGGNHALNIGVLDAGAIQ